MLGKWAVLKRVRGSVPSEVMHPVQRLIEGPRDRLRCGEAHVHGRGKARAGRRGHMRDVLRLNAGILEGDLESGDDRVQVSARGDLGNHSPELRVFRRGRGKPLT